MAEFESDLLFRIHRKDREKADAFIYVLWEHQRNRDSLMVLRVWIYLAMIYRHLVATGNLIDGKLPFVYPIVLYQGTEGWRKGTVLEDLIDLDGIPSDLIKWVPRFAFDLIRLDEDSPRIRPTAPVPRLGLEILRAVMFGTVEEWLRENITHLDELFPGHKQEITLIFTYALLTGEGLTQASIREIITNDMNIAYLPNTVMDQLVRERNEMIANLTAEKDLAEEKARQTEEKARQTEEKAKREKQESALHLISIGLSDEQICAALNLPPQRVAELRKDSTA